MRSWSYTRAYNGGKQFVYDHPYITGVAVGTVVVGIGVAVAIKVACSLAGWPGSFTGKETTANEQAEGIRKMYHRVLGMGTHTVKTGYGINQIIKNPDLMNSVCGLVK